MKIVNVGIIGYGLSGRIFHGAIINSIKGFKICKIVTKDQTKKIQAIEDVNGVSVVDNPEDVFDDENIDLVVISTPNTSHLALAKHAMLSGKNVVIEKPFTITTLEAQELVDISKEMGCVLSVYQNRRFDGDYKTIKSIINEGNLGRLVELESHFDRFRNEFKENAWREKALPGSGILYDLGSHLIDQALDLFGLPQEIYADIRFQRNGNVDDNFELILYYPELKVTLKSGSLVKEELPRFLLLGTKGTFMKYGLDIQEGALRNEERPLDESWGSEPKSSWGVLNTITERKHVETMQGDYREYYNNIYNAIVNGEKLLITGQDGYNVIKIIEAAIQSNNQKKRIEIK